MNKEDRSLHLLVIEDNRGDLLLIEDFLFEKIQTPYIQDARTFQEAKHYLVEEGKVYDAILLDLSLPDRSGEALLDEILTIAKTIPVIVLTGYSDIGFGIKSLALGIADYLLKDELTATSLYKSILYSIERKEISRNLMESEKRYRDLFHLSPQPMWVYDVETLAFLDVNQAAVEHYGYSKEEFLSMTILEIRPPEDVLNFKKKVYEINHKNDPSKAKNSFTHQKKNGEQIKVDVKSTLIDFQKRKARLVLAHDITERLNYIRDIEENNERLQEIAWIQSHVVRAPLARLMGLIYAISDTVDDENDYQQLHRLILKSANELDEIIRDIAVKADRINITSLNEEKPN